MHKTIPIVVVAALLGVLVGCGGRDERAATSPEVVEPTVAPSDALSALQGVAPPPAGKLYHGFYFSTMNGNEHGVTPEDVQTYENAVGKQAAWVYFSDNWFEDTHFPLSRCKWIRNLGKAPYIRMMIRSDWDVPDPPYNLRRLLSTTYDAELRQWFRDAKSFGTPLLVEYGVECNGWWFPWNGKWNGGATKDGYGNPNKADGPERFVAVYRKLVSLSRQEGATNLTWVWHIDVEDDPATAWNRFERYYPGDSYVDWIGVSDYGPQSPVDKWGEPFAVRLDRVYPRLTALTAEKPIIVSEFGCALRNTEFEAHKWADSALSGLLSDRWPRVAGFCWWNETWENDDNPAHDTDMVIWHDPALTRVWKNQLKANQAKLQQTPVFTSG